MKSLLLTTVLLSFMSMAVFSQTNPNEFKASKLKLAKSLPQEGTYQIIFKASNGKPVLDKEILYKVSAKRKVEEFIYLTVNKTVKIKVLPYDIIRAEEFKPWPTYLPYE